MYIIYMYIIYMYILYMYIILFKVSPESQVSFALCALYTSRFVRVFPHQRPIHGRAFLFSISKRLR